MNTKFYSQVGQDKWVCEYFKYKRDGFFLDIGAADGITISNTYYLEKELGWKGICIEALKSNYDKLINNRNTICEHKAVYHKKKTIYFLGDGNDGLGGYIAGPDKYTEMVDAVRIEDILKEHNAPKTIDYISLDIEGKEVQALMGFPFDEYEVILWTIEHNLHGGFTGQLLKQGIKEIMIKNGYAILKENVGTAPQYPMEDWYINTKYLNK